MPKKKRTTFKRKKTSVSPCVGQKLRERKTMASLSDVKAWKEILNELKSSSEQNEVVISEIKEEIALQEQRNKREVQKQYEQLRDQTQALENLLQTLQTGTLFSLPADQDTLSSFEQTLNERLELSRQLMEDAKTLLDSQTTPTETLEKLRNGSRRERNRSLLRNATSKEQLSKEDREAREAQSLTAIANISTTGFPSLSDESQEESESQTSTKEAKAIRRNGRTSQQENKALPMRANTTKTKTSWDGRASNTANSQEELAVRAKFPRQALLGNWIHYFSKEMFTCQCFWDDSEFKEYDFKNNELVEERSGKFHVKDGKVYMDYDEGRQAVYTVTGYSNDCLDYLINRTPIRFDYMPEELLNTLLENASHYSYSN